MFAERSWKKLYDTAYISPTDEISGIKLCSDEKGHEWLAVTIFPDNIGERARHRFAWEIIGTIDRNPLFFSEVSAGNIARKITDEEREEIATVNGYDPNWIEENIYFEAGWRRKRGIWSPYTKAHLSIDKKVPVKRYDGKQGWGVHSFGIPFPVESIADGMTHLTRSMHKTPLEYLFYAREMEEAGEPIRLPCDPVLASFV